MTENDKVEVVLVNTLHYCVVFGLCIEVKEEDTHCDVYRVLM